MVVAVVAATKEVSAHVVNVNIIIVIAVAVVSNKEDACDITTIILRSKSDDLLELEH